MKVMCIDASNYVPVAIVIPEGDIVTATQSIEYDDCYDIFEYPLTKFGAPIAYYKYRFIPLSNIDETELIRERQKQLE